MSTEIVTSANHTPEQVQQQLKEFDSASGKETAQSVEETKVPAKTEAAESDTAEAEAEVEEEGDVEGSAEDSESDEDEESKEDDSAKEKPNKKSGYKKRIDKLRGRVSRAEQERDHWRQEALKGKPAETKSETIETKSEPAGKPKPDDFETHVEYVEALTDWTVDQKAKAATEKENRANLEKEERQVFESHEKRVKAFIEKNADFVDALSDVEDVKMSAAVERMLITSENGPELMLELAKSREEFVRINGLSPMDAARALGRIEARIAKASDVKKEPEIKKPTKAPAPVSPIGSKGGRSEKSLDEAASSSQAEFERIRNKQLAEKRA